jgi:hypothetical protein
MNKIICMFKAFQNITDPRLHLGLIIFSPSPFVKLNGENNIPDVGTTKEMLIISLLTLSVMALVGCALA